MHSLFQAFGGFLVVEASVQECLQELSLARQVTRISNRNTRLKAPVRCETSSLKERCLSCCANRSRYKRRIFCVLDILRLRQYFSFANLLQNGGTCAELRLISLRWWREYLSNLGKRLLIVGVKKHLLKSLSFRLVVFRFYLCFEQEQLLLVIHFAITQWLIILEET